MGRHLARASEANAALLGSLAALAGPGADQLALPDASAQGGPRIAQASRYHRETCPDRDDAARELARVCKAWARVPAGIANARARSVAAPIANREQQKSTGGGRKCSQLFSVEPEGAFWNVGDVVGLAVGVDVGQLDGEVGARRIGRDEQDGTDRPGHLHVVCKRLAGVHQDVAAAFDI